MSDNFDLDIIKNDAKLEKLCTDSVELINYARNVVVNHVNTVQIMTYYSLGRWIWKHNKWENCEQNMEVKLLKHYQKRLPDKKLLQYKLRELA